MNNKRDKPIYQIRMLRDLSVKLKSRTVTFPLGSVVTAADYDEDALYVAAPRDDDCSDWDWICFNRGPNEERFGFKIEMYKEN